MVQNKTGLVVKGYNQAEGLGYYKTFAPVAKLEAIRLLIAYAAHKGVKFYQGLKMPQCQTMCTKLKKSFMV